MILFSIFIYCHLVSLCTCLPWCIHRGQRATFRSQFSLSLVGPGKRSQVLRLEWPGIYKLSHVSTPRALLQSACRHCILHCHTCVTSRKASWHGWWFGLKTLLKSQNCHCDSSVSAVSLTSTVKASHRVSKVTVAVWFSAVCVLSQSPCHLSELSLIHISEPTRRP